MHPSIEPASTSRRRLVLGGIGAWLAAERPPVFARPDMGTAIARPDPFTYDYIDYWDRPEVRARERRARLYPTVPPLDRDVKTAEALLAKAPTDSPLAIMRYFAELSEVGASGERFNSRWAPYENPVIVWFFHATALMPKRGDCSSWCAAFLSWTLERAGVASAHSASSVDFAQFGKPVTAAPRPGDVVVFQDLADEAQGHVGLFLEQNATQIRVLGGNEGRGTDIPACSKGHPLSTIGAQWHDKRGNGRVVRAIRRYG